MKLYSTIPLVANDEMVANIEKETPKEVANKIANKHGKYADKQKRLDYMKEYMAKRRNK